ncbi:hypothetical protein REJC140_01885 [Pseudorhizobium endolithicum]|uniref:Cytochrome C oxidase subunit I n=1 Tax=Pseudorhizobium endolithicum TaxID=1191678 RepID=A0ABM8PWR3_9HYPH|nr:DUF2189 domain-containing protein [Pseudorhizobium endolithicum]CAD7052598.1 hypothetical protein REJC140_01885 [Pseudorhizobium endolithicum]
MKTPGKTYGLLSETSTIEETRNPLFKRNLSARAPLQWLSQGWSDLWVQPLLSLGYGLGVFILSVIFVWLLFVGQRDYYLFPAMAGFLIIAPLLAAGLYAKSRAIESGERISARRMLLIRAETGTHIFFTGLLLVLLFLLWMRAAVLIYALFFGVSPFLGFSQIVPVLLTTPTGWAMLLVGGFVGSLFAGFAFGVSVFSIPMLLDKRVDTLTAMGTSMALVWNNLKPMLAWGAIVLGLFLLCLATALAGLVVVFPLLGHATWHAYREMAGGGSHDDAPLK